MEGLLELLKKAKEAMGGERLQTLRTTEVSTGAETSQMEVDAVGGENVAPASSSVVVAGGEAGTDKDLDRPVVGVDEGVDVEGRAGGQQTKRDGDVHDGLVEGRSGVNELPKDDMAEKARSAQLSGDAPATTGDDSATKEQTAEKPETESASKAHVSADGGSSGDVTKPNDDAMKVVADSIGETSPATDASKANGDVIPAQTDGPGDAEPSAPSKPVSRPTSSEKTDERSAEEDQELPKEPGSAEEKKNVQGQEQEGRQEETEFDPRKVLLPLPKIEGSKYCSRACGLMVAKMALKPFMGLVPRKKGRKEGKERVPEGEGDAMEIDSVGVSGTTASATETEKEQDSSSSQSAPTQPSSSSNQPATQNRHSPSLDHQPHSTPSHPHSHTHPQRHAPPTYHSIPSTSLPGPIRMELSDLDRISHLNRLKQSCKSKIRMLERRARLADRAVERARRINAGVLGVGKRGKGSVRGNGTGRGRGRGREIGV
ncbi:hypothetical protein HK102_011049 [Quaeritorhiza haematococci]|nr:hypothetical protein HK102_011049 [Quaeritorhiza haematococci]